VPRFFWTVLSMALLVGLWWGAASTLGLRNLPPPDEVLDLLIEEARSGDLFFHLAATLARVAAAFFIAMAVGTAIGIALGRNAQANRFFDPWLILGLNMPALVTIVLCYVWFGLTEAAAVAAVALNKIPNVAVTVREGARALEPGYDDVAKIYRFGFGKRLKAVILPQLEPYLAAAVRSGLALIWKIVLVVELLGRSNGVGFQIQLYFQNFDIGRILAYALAFIVIVQAIEWGLIRPWEQRVRRWRLDDGR
jgi:NitT/TauT family transport system permease protein